MIDLHQVKRMSKGRKDVTVHHSQSALTVCLVHWCVGVYPRLQLPCALATEGICCFQRGFHKVFGRISSPPSLSHSSLPPFSVLLSLSPLAFLLVWVLEFARDSWLEGRKLLFWYLKRYLTADCSAVPCMVLQLIYKGVMDRRKSSGRAVPKPKPKPKPAKPYPKLQSAPGAPSGTLSEPVPFLHVLLPLPAPAPQAIPPPPQLAHVPLPAALAPPPMLSPSCSSSPSSSSASASPEPSALDTIYHSPLSLSSTPPARIPPPITNTRIPFPRSYLPVQSLFGPGRQLEPVGRWAVVPGSDGLRLRWADAQLDSIQLSEQRLLPGAVDPRLVPALLPAADDPTAPAAVDPAVPVADDPAVHAAVDPAVPMAIDPAVPMAVDLAVPMAVDPAVPAAVIPAAVGEERCP